MVTSSTVRAPVLGKEVTKGCICGVRSGTLGHVTTEKDPSKGLNAAIAATLNGERVAAGLSFDDLAQRTGISSRTLKRYLSSAERHIDVNTLGSISVALDVPLEEVLTSANRRLRGSLPSDPGRIA